MKTEDEILHVLQSITMLRIEDGRLDVKLAGDTYVSGIVEYVPNSFTRELLELIEAHMTKEE